MGLPEDPRTGHFIFIANDIQIDDRRTTLATEIARELLSRGFWAFSEAAPLRAKLKQGDRVLVYLAGHGRRYFTARAVAAGPSYSLAGTEATLLADMGLGFMPHGIRLSEVQDLRPVVPISEHISQLGFIKDKKNYGLHLRLPIARISPEDFRLITPF